MKTPLKYARMKGIRLSKENGMAFGEEKHKKTAFEKLTMVVVVLMVIATLVGLIFPAVNALMN